MKFKIILIITMCILSTTCHAEDNAADLLDCCKLALHPEKINNVDDLTKANTCQSYISGYIDMYYAYAAAYGKEKAIFNIPDETKTKEIIEVVVAFLEDNPKILNEYRGYSIFLAIIHNFPPTSESEKSNTK